MSLLFSFFWILILSYLLYKVFEAKLTISRIHLLFAFIYKLGFTFFLISIYQSYYSNRSLADIFKYYDDAQILFGIIQDDPISYFKLLFGISEEDQYMSTLTETSTWYTIGFGSDHLYNDSRTVIRANALLIPFSFGNYYIQAFYFTLIGLAGQICLYQSFKKLIPNKKNLLFVAIFLMPTVTIWTSGILKESFLFLGIAGLIHFLINSKENNITIKDFVYLFVSIAILMAFKYYVLLCFIPGLLGYYFWNRSKFLIQIKYFLSIIILFICALSVKYFFPQYDIMQMLAKKHDDFYLLALEMNANSLSYIGKYKPELNQFIPKVPHALYNTLVLPFIHQINSASLMMIPNIIENTLLILLSIIAFIFREKDIPKKDLNFILFFISFILCLYTISGLTTPVIGGLVRYKAPGMLFHAIILCWIVDIDKVQNYLKSKILFKKQTNNV